jgi:hypothetical protein
MDPLQLPVQGTVVVFVFLLLGAGKAGTLPLALATTVLVSPWFVRVKTMWRQAPITARFWLMKPPRGPGRGRLTRAEACRTDRRRWALGSACRRGAEVRKPALAPKLLIPVNLPLAWRQHTAHIERARFIREEEFIDGRNHTTLGMAFVRPALR